MSVLAQWKELCMVIVTWEKLWHVHLLTDQKNKTKTKTVQCWMELLKMFEADGAKPPLQHCYPWQNLVEPLWHPWWRGDCWLERPVVFWLGFESQKWQFFSPPPPFLFYNMESSHGWHSNTQHLLQHTMLKLFYQQWSNHLLCPVLPVRRCTSNVKVTVTFLKEQTIQVMTHPPCCSDLAPCHFWLAGQKCSCIQDPTRAINSGLHTLSSCD